MFISKDVILFFALIPTGGSVAKLEAVPLKFTKRWFTRSEMTMVVLEGAFFRLDPVLFCWRLWWKGVQKGVGKIVGRSTETNLAISVALHLSPGLMNYNLQAQYLGSLLDIWDKNKSTSGVSFTLHIFGTFLEVPILNCPLSLISSNLPPYLFRERMIRYSYYDA